MKVPKAKQLPSGRWFVRLRLGGSSYSRTFDSQKDASAWAASIKAQYKANQLESKTDDEKKTVHRLIEEYLESAQLAPNTVACYKATMRNHFKQAMYRPYCEIRNWQKIVNLDLARYNPNTVSLHWSKICAALRFHGLGIPSVKIPKKAHQQKSYLTAAQIPLFCRAIYGHRHEVLFLMMLSSMRVSEALSVRAEDITSDGIHVRGTKTDASDRFVPFMIPRLKELCSDLPQSDRRVLNKELKTICADAGLPPLSCHSLRVSFASVCYMNAVPERICMKIGGWTSLQTMHQVYVRISDDDVRKYADVLRDAFSG